MATRSEIETRLEELIRSDYYAEDFELLSHVQAFQAALSPAERRDLELIVLARLLREGSLVDVLLCTVVDVPEAVPALVNLLHREQVTSQQTRAIMTALRRYGGGEAYEAVERFLDSEQEVEALAVLARMDFIRTLPHLVRLIRKDHYLDPCLHILHERGKQVGLEQLAGELKQAVARHAAPLRERLARALTGKPKAYNPFTPQELQTLLSALTPGADSF